MPDTKAFDKHYRALSDEELLKLAAEGGFTAEPAQLLARNSHDATSRSIKPSDALLLSGLIKQMWVTSVS